MNNKKSCLLILVLFLLALFSPGRVAAQEGILDGFSYLYLEKLIATAKENYPRLKTYNSQVAAAKSDLSGAKLSWLDPFSFQYVTRSNKASSNLVDITTADILNGYQFGVTINPGTLLAKPSKIKRAKEEVKIAQSNEEEYNLSLETEVKKRYFSYLQYQKSILPINNAFLDAENNFKVIKIAYQKAEVTLLEYNNASIAYNQAYANKLQVEVNYMAAKASLEELTVKKLEEIK